MEVYTVEEIYEVLHILESLQDQMAIEELGIEWDMLQEAINILAQEDDEI